MVRMVIKSRILDTGIRIAQFDRQYIPRGSSMRLARIENRLLCMNRNESKRMNPILVAAFLEDNE